MNRLKSRTTKNILFGAMALLLAANFVACDKQQTCSAESNFNKSIKGCGDFSVYQIVDTNLILGVRINNKKIAFSTDLQTFGNIANEDFATVSLEQNCEIEKVFCETCNDVPCGNNCQSTFWTLTKGKLSFKVSRVLKEYKCYDPYCATVILEDAEFKKDGSNEMRILERVEFNDVFVGWCAG